MKKLVKMSLVAAVAVAGLSTTASAKSMEESIKGVDFSGYIRYRYTGGDNTYTYTDATGATQTSNTESHEYKTVVKVKAPINDSVSAFVKVAQASEVNDVTGDADPQHATVKCANFQFNMGGATVIAGKQALQTPFADQADQQGTGLVAIAPVGAVTLAGGWYFNSEIGDANIAAVAAMGKAAAVDYAVWFADISNVASAYNVNVAGAAGPVSLELNHASVDYETAIGLGTQEQTRVVASAKAGAATVTAGVVMTGEDGGDVTLGDTDASANFALENLSSSVTADDTVIYLGVSAPVGPVTVGLEYADADEADADETKLSVAYAMSSNFNISGFATTSDAVGDMTRLELKYTF
jgi:hypothetical protein